MANDHIPQDQEKRRAMHGDDYVQRFSDKGQQRRLAALLAQVDLPPHAIVLDIGCGTGLWAALLAKRVANYTGVDFSQPMVSAAQELAAASHLANCNFICGDARDVMARHPDGFDAIFALDISEHVPDSEWGEIVAAAKESLKPGGVFYLHTPNLDFFVERMKQVGLMRQFPEHIAVRTVRQNSSFFVEAHYDSMECRTLPHYNRLGALHRLAALPFVGRFFSARVWIAATK